MKKAFIYTILLCFTCIYSAINAQSANEQVEGYTQPGNVDIEDQENITEKEPVTVYGDKDAYFNKRYYDRERLAALREKKDFKYNDDVANDFKKEWEARKANNELQDEIKKAKEKSGGSDRKLNPREKKEDNYENRDREINTSSLNINWLFVILLGVGIVLLVLYFTGFTPRALLNKNKAIDAANNNITDDEHIDNIAFETEIEKAIRLKNYRLAIRLLYLEVLKKLNDNKQINWQPNKTNWDYVSEIQPETLKKSFQKITSTFDYAWYGNFNIDESTFTLVQEQISKFKQKI